jgi:serine/threonine protein kinase
MERGSDLEDLLAQALAAHDAGPDQLADFLTRHGEDRAAIERGLERCRQMGLLGTTIAGAGDRDFPDRLGPFRLLRRLGSGGMGTVYEALQDDLGRKVALKVIRPELLYVAGARERFRREIDAIGHLDHPAIVGIVAAGEHEGIPYFAMQLLAGATVAEATAPLRGRPLASLRGSDLQQAIGAAIGRSDQAGAELPTTFAGAYWEAAVRMIAQIGLGLAHAHAHGIVHRDLKPSNVMLMPDGRAIVLDFGIARVRGARELTRSSAPGSPAFMSPEQLRSEPIDERTDVYSLGLTLWQLLMREPPFANQQSENDILRGDLPPLLLERGAPRDLGVVLRMATDRDRQHRYRTMAEFAADLRAVLERAPIRGRPLPWTLRLTRLVQRHRVATVVATMLVVAAIVVPIALQAERAAAERSVAAAAERAELSLLATLDTLAANEERMGGTDLPDVAEVDPLARAMLEDSLYRYRELLVAHRGHARLQRQAAAAMYRWGQLRSRGGDAKAAIELFEEALATLGELPSDAPSNTHELRGLVHLGLAAEASRRQQLADARVHCDRAEHDFAVLETRAPGSIPSLRSRSELAIQVAKLYPERDQIEIHERHLRHALALATTWRQQQPDSIEARTHACGDTAVSACSCVAPARSMPLPSSCRRR